MRIGLITGEYPPMRGGLASYTQLLAQQLHAQGHQIFILSSEEAVQQTDHLPLITVRNWGLDILRSIPQWAEDNQLDVVNLQFQTAAFGMSPWVHFLPQRMRTHFVTTFHDLRFPYLFPKAGKLRDWIVMHLAKTSSGVIVTNTEDQQRIATLAQVAMIPIGTNILFEPLSEAAREQWQQKIGANQDDFLIAHFGFINHSKGIDTLLQALHQLDDPHIKLLMIGERLGASDATNATYAQEIDQLIQALDLEEHITWTGYAVDQDISATLQIADVIVLPYRDGASYRRGTLMAAIEHSKAIITTQPSIPVTDFTSANMMLVEPDDAVALAEAIRQVHADATLRENLEKGAAALRQHFVWDGIAEQTSHFYKQVVEANR